MIALPSPEQLADLLHPYVSAPIQLADREVSPFTPSGQLLRGLFEYLALLLRWNARTNLTAVREPVLIVKRHFGESLFCARILAALLSSEAEILDFGSGAGFPGIPLQLVLPHARVVLAESQGKKAAFLREAVRVLGLSSEVLAARVESLPSTRRFDAITLRAVDDSALARTHAESRLRENGWLAELTSRNHEAGIQIPGEHSGVVLLTRFPAGAHYVPRGTMA